MTDDAPTIGRAEHRGGWLQVLFGGGVLDRLPAAIDWLVSIALILPRLWLASIFWNAGQARLANWNSQEFLFTHFHAVPLLPPSVAALVTTAAELTMPVLLVLGLLGRIGALGLFAMTFTIQFIVFQTETGINDFGATPVTNPEHFLWMAAALLMVITGPGRISLDQLIRTRLLKG